MDTQNKQHQTSGGNAHVHPIFQPIVEALATGPMESEPVADCFYCAGNGVEQNGEPCPRGCSVPSAPPQVEFKATAKMPRRLLVDLSVGRRLYVRAYAPGKAVVPLASADAWMADVTLSYRDFGRFLHVGTALFHLTESEAAEIERLFGPLGLKVRREVQS